MSQKAINKIKVVLVEKSLSSKWLAKQLARMKQQFQDSVFMTYNHFEEISQLQNYWCSDYRLV